MLSALASTAGGNRAAVVFVHGFSGDYRETWNRVPEFLKADARLSGWDFFGFGYPSKILSFDLPGLWSADPRLEEIALEFYTESKAAPLKRYERLALVAHSMGGLVLQRAITQHDDLRKRLSHVLFFGTPSGGLRKASALQFWKRQIKNMAEGGEFITGLRRRWSELELDSRPPFRFLTVAGDLDQFVPPSSSLGPFPDPVRRVIPGNHVSMLKASGAGSHVVRTIADALTEGAAEAGPRDAARVAIEMGRFQQVIDQFWKTRLEIDTEAAVQLAMALEKYGRQAEAVAYLRERLEKKLDPGTDLFGVLGGRLKRLWHVGRRRADVEEARHLYGLGYQLSTEARDAAQAFYHGINLAYLDLAYGGDFEAAEERARAVLEHCREAETKEKSPDPWRFATQGDARMILGEVADGLRRHRAAVALNPEPWQAFSMQEQAIRIADLCGHDDAVEALSGIYERGGR